MSDPQQQLNLAYDIALGLIEVARTETPETLFSRVMLQRSRALRDELEAALSTGAVPSVSQPQGEADNSVVLAAEDYAVRHSRVNGQKFGISELVNLKAWFYAGARCSVKHPAADVLGPQSDTMAVPSVSPAPQEQEHDHSRHADWWLCFRCWQAFYVPTSGYFCDCPECHKPTVPWPQTAGDPRERVSMTEWRRGPALISQALAQPQPVDAVDPQASDPGKPTTREKDNAAVSTPDLSQLIATLKELTEACERDFCSDATDCLGDGVSVMDSVLDGSYLKFGMIRRARQALLSQTPCQ